MKIVNSIVDILKKVEQSLVRVDREPKIEQKCDRYGNQYWLAYDARTNRSYTFSSEQDVRVWIENRYHSF